MSGISTALDEVTLVLFTTLGPSGAMAYALMALPLIVRGDAMDPKVRKRLDQLLCIPVVVAMVGLVASATHLGNPANALYVISGFGRSPLSNEVVCGAVFLGVAGVFWLTSFSEGTGRVAARRVVAAIASVLGLVFVGVISLAYDASTIVTWNTPYTPLTTWLNALSGGTLLAICGMRAARFHTQRHALGRWLAVASAAAFAASIAVYVSWGLMLPGMHNAMASASELAPLFWPALAVFSVLGIVALVLGVRTVSWKGEAPIWIPVASVLLMLAAIFVMRFQFYMIHMTVGVGV